MSTLLVIPVALSTNITVEPTSMILMKAILVSIVVLPKESHQHNATQVFAKEVNDNFGNLVA